MKANETLTLEEFNRRQAAKSQEAKAKRPAKARTQKVVNPDKVITIPKPKKAAKPRRVKVTSRKRARVAAKPDAPDGLAPAIDAAASSNQVYAILYDLHSYFNERVFKPKGTTLPKPVFTVAPLGRKRLGHFSPARWSGTNTETGDVQRLVKTTPDEINVHSEQGMARPFMAVAATVYHEMCHQAQYHYPAVYGKESANNYHNKDWHQTGQLCGLQTSGGNGLTKVTVEFTAFMKDFPNPERWVARRHVAGAVAPTRLKKWVCKCKTHVVNVEGNVERQGPYVIRVAGSGLIARCEHCQKFFKPVDDSDAIVVSGGRR